MRPCIEESFVWFEFEFDGEEHYKFQVLKEKFNLDNSESPHDPKDAVRHVNAVDPLSNCAFIVKQHLVEDWEKVFYKDMKND